MGAEALARWHHPELGELGADELFSAADRCDLREELSYAIQRQAVSHALDWPNMVQPLRLSINLGAEELADDHAERLLTILDESGFPCERLTVELTEESIVRDFDLAMAQLQMLRSKNVSVAIDDFGTGYSSLAYLKSLPVDYLKIDKGMIAEISGNPRDLIVLRAIIALGKALDLKIIAEGVEKIANWRFCAPKVVTFSKASCSASRFQHPNLPSSSLNRRSYAALRASPARPFESCRQPLSLLAGSGQLRVITNLLSGRSFAEAPKRST